jgi:DNA-binding GntR family transcriptional regulator
MNESPPLNQIRNKSLREHVLDTLRGAILNGELRPGQTLVEMEIAAQLGVSRAPLREAIHILNSEGLLETIPYHGTTVRKLTRADIEELYSLRSVLESFAVQRIVERGEEGDISSLHDLYEQLLAAAKTNSWSEVNTLDRRFHDEIIQLSGHSLLATTWSNVAMRVQQVMSLLNLHNRDITQVAQNHVPIIEAIEARDLDTALVEIRQHIANTGDLIAAGWHVEDDSETDNIDVQEDAS